MQNRGRAANLMANQQDVQHQISKDGEHPIEHNQNSNTKNQDEPQGAESVQNNEEVSNILWEGAMSSNHEQSTDILDHFLQGWKEYSTLIRMGR